MADTKITDLVIPEVYGVYAKELNLSKSHLIKSNISVKNNYLESLMENGGASVIIPALKDLSGDFNIGSDDPSQVVTTDKVSSIKQVVPVLDANKSYSNMDLAVELSGEEVNKHVAERFDDFWSRSTDKLFAQIITGLVNSDVAGSSDLTTVTANEDGSNATATEKFNSDTVLDAISALGEVDTLTTIVVHPAIYTQMRKNDDIDTVVDSQNNPINLYMGMRVLVDSNMPKIAGSTSGFKYITAVLGRGAFHYGVTNPAVPFEVERDSRAGNGAGQTILTSRKRIAVAPVGFSVNGTDFSPATLQTAGAWSKVGTRENIPMAFMVTN